MPDSISSPFDYFRLNPRSVGHASYYHYTLLALARSFEDLIFTTSHENTNHQNPFRALIYATFQSAELFREELPRYRLLAEQSKQIYVFVRTSAEEFSGESIPPNMTLIPLEEKDPLAKEWHLVIHAPSCAAMMCAKEIVREEENQALRAYDGFWSLDPNLVAEGVRVFEAILDNRLGKRSFSGEEHITRNLAVSSDPLWTLTAMTIDIIQSLQEMNHQAILKTIEVEYEKKNTEQAYKDTFTRLSNAAEFRHGETAAHILRIGEYSAIIARTLGLPPDVVERIHYAAPMHDIGKMAIPDAILQKPGKLNSDEWEVMKGHTTIGSRVLRGSNSPLMRTAKRIAHFHHERFDGSGYPWGLSGHDIPIEARIVAITDVFDALVSPRCYKLAFPYDEALKIIAEGVGNHFDPAVGEAFFAHLDEMISIHKTMSG